MMRKIVFAFLLILLSCVPVRAATTVYSATELAAAIANTASGDIVLGTNITMNSASSDIPIGRSLKVSAGGGSTLYGDNTYRIFSVNSGNVTFENITFSGGQTAASGGAVSIEGSGGASFSGCTFRANNAGGSGGSVNVKSGGSVSFVNGTTFENNTAGNTGGAVNLETGATASFAGSVVFKGNTAASGGAFASLSSSPISFADGATFTSNRATGGSGGAVSATGNLTFNGTVSATDNTASVSGGVIDTTGSVTLVGGTFGSNKAGTGSGGAISAGSVSASANVTFTGNEAGTSGGAISSSGGVTLAGGTFSGNKANGATGDGGAINAGTVALNAAVTFADNTAGRNGGAIATTLASGGASLNAGTFTSNTAAGSGGAVYAEGTVTFTTGSFSSNTATTGSGGAIHTVGGISLPSTTVATFTGNTSALDGGAVRSGADIAMTGATFTGNRTTVSGGGGATHSTGNSTFTDCVFGRSGAGNGNSAMESGGAVSCGGTLIADRCSFTGNVTGRDGGALYIQGAGSVVSRIDGCRLTGNTATKDGGAVHFGSTNLSIVFRRSMFSGNAAADANSGGGAVFVTGTATFERCTFTGNTANAAAGSVKNTMGGAVYAAPVGSVDFTNCTFTRNETRSMGGDSLGGALYLKGKGSLLYCTVTAQNSASSRGTGRNGLGGGVYIAGGPVAITACAVAGNEASFGADIFREGGVTINSGGYNRLGTYGITSQGYATDYPWNSDSNIKGARDEDQEGISQLSMFGAGTLADNITSGVNAADVTVGATADSGILLTLALLLNTTNPALDQIPYREGSLLASRVDERNLTRPQPDNGLFDVGAFEAEQSGGPGPNPDPEVYYVNYVKMSGIPNTMTKIGQTCSLTAIVYPNRAPQGVTWASSMPSVARIDTYGNLVSLSRGTTTITATSVGMKSDGKRATDSVVLDVTDEMTWTNVHPDVWIRLGVYNSGMQQYAEQLYLVDSDPAAVAASSFQSAFGNAYGVAAAQVTELQNASAFTFDSKSSYTGSNWVSAKPSIRVAMSSLPYGGGSLLPLEFTWSLTWDEVGKIMGRTVTRIDSVTELFGRLKILFEATDGSTMPVVDQDGEFGIAASKALSSGVLALANGNNGLTLTLRIMMGDVSGNGGRPSLIGGKLVVADNVVDGTAGGSLWLLKRTGGSGGEESSGGGGSGGCNGGFGYAVLLLTGALLLKRSR